MKTGEDGNVDIKLILQFEANFNIVGWYLIQSMDFLAY
jgi:hypothetical protein